jgi:hypothetical protein
MIPTTRLSVRTERGNDAWYSGEHKQHGGNLQVLYDPHGFPIWGTTVEPGSVHDITAARRHVFPVLNHAAANRLPVLVDLGYRGADIGCDHAVNRPNLDPTTKARNRFLTVLRCICERGKRAPQGWLALPPPHHLLPQRITQIGRAALSLTHPAYGW